MWDYYIDNTFVQNCVFFRVGDSMHFMTGRAWAPECIKVSEATFYASDICMCRTYPFTQVQCQ